MDTSVYAATCSCGEVQFEVSGQPVAMGYCDCASCRRWSMTSVNVFPLWRPRSLRVSRGATLIRAYTKTATSHRKWCKRCGDALYTEHASLDLIGVYATLIPQVTLEASSHLQHCSCMSG